MSTTLLACTKHTVEDVERSRELDRLDREALRIIVLAVLAEGDRTAGEISKRLGWTTRPVHYYCTGCRRQYIGGLAEMVTGSEAVSRALRWQEKQGHVRRVVLGGTRPQLWTLVGEPR